MNPYYNSFQEIGTYFRQKLTRWPGKFVLSKKTPQNGLFWWTQIWVTELWKALDAKRLTPGQLEAYPWKLWGMAVQTSYSGGRWHQKPTTFFSVGTQNLAKKWFFGKTLRTRKLLTGKFFGAGTHGTESLRTQDSENIVGFGDRASVSKL